jgi:hypothetical protein
LNIEKITAHPTVVPYHGKSTITNLLAVGNYHWVAEDITDENFPQARKTDDEVSIQIIRVDHEVSTIEALRELGDCGRTQGCSVLRTLKGRPTPAPSRSKPWPENSAYPAFGPHVDLHRFHLTLNASNLQHA